MGNKYKPVITKLLWVLLIPIGIILTNIASKNPETVERVYSERLYKGFSQYYSRFFGLFPFSAAEVLLYLLIAAVLLKVVLAVYHILKNRSFRKYDILNSVAKVLMFISIAYMFFIAAWGMNYYRLPFARLAGYDQKAVDATELAAVCKQLIKDANEQRSKVSEDTKGVMQIKDASGSILKKVGDCYRKASEAYPQLAGTYGNPKPVALSVVMSYQGISGIYSPFTAEANVNMDNPDSMLPCTACHEAAHLRGFAREDEANFIAYIVCSYSDDPQFRYSGTLLALIYSMNALRSADSDTYQELREEYSAGVVRDLEAIDEFWDRYSGPIERTSNKVNNTYLKANKQAQGVASYGRMVDLLIMKYRKDGLKP